jgi:hypothetical protein
MTTTIKLSDTQRTVLLQAAERPDGNIEPLPPQLKGGARQKVIDGLLSRDLSRKKRKDIVITDAGYAAVGCTRPQVATPADPALDAAVTVAEATWQGDGQLREKSKQAQVIAMLKRPEGATIAQICETTGWQAHTVRGTFAGAFKKKLKLDITSTKEAGADRVYMISAGA